MYRHSENRRPGRLLACTAMAAVLVTGFAASGQLALASSASVSSKEERKLDKAVTKAEQKVAKAPQAIALRLELANAYLAAGRFESAIDTYKDAQFLGDKSVRTALSLALAHIAAGQDQDALAVLDEWRDAIPASDLGLALALAGETGRGVAILSDALRDGDDSPKLRQNLAYAYALDGRWREARVMAAQDVPAEKLDERISDWARAGRPDDYRNRVASLLHVPLRGDAGQPQYLALAERKSEALAMAEPPTAASDELPPVEQGESFWIADAVKPEEPEALAASAEPATRDFDQAFAESSESVAVPGVKFVAKPVVQQLPVRTAAAEPSRASRKVSSVHGLVQTHQAVAVPAANPEDRTHLVQLGSFSSAENADRAWRIFVSRNPELNNFDKTITKARVRGKIYWRVAAAGFDKSNAMTMCSNVKGAGHGCFAYAEAHPLPGTIAGSTRSGLAKAR